MGGKGDHFSDLVLDLSPRGRESGPRKVLEENLLAGLNYRRLCRFPITGSANSQRECESAKGVKIELERRL